MNDRRSIRKRGHDYAAPGQYFVTLCVRNRDPLLGGIDGDAMVLSAVGLIVQEEWRGLPARFPTARLDAFTIMPNHMHGIVAIVGAPLAGARPVDQPDGVDRGESETTRSGLPTVRAGASPAPTTTTTSLPTITNWNESGRTSAATSAHGVMIQIAYQRPRRSQIPTSACT